jgi:hypothetical protein
MNPTRTASWWGRSTAAGLTLAVLLAACDTGPGPTPLDQAPPTVSDLRIAPDTVRVADLPSDQVVDGQALVELDLQVEARDADGSVNRVLVIIEPAYGPSAAGITQLNRLDGVRYGGRRGYSVAADQADVFTIRALAIDNDSLTSNEAVGQFYVLPADPSE